MRGSKMRKFVILVILITLQIFISSGYCQNKAGRDELKEKVDSLYIVSNGVSEKYRDLAQPAESTLVAMGEIAVPYLMDKLTTQDAREKWTLIRILGKIGKPAVLPLIGKLESPNKDEAEISVRILGDIKDTSAVRPLIKLLTKDNYNLRSNVCESLGKIGDKSAFEDLNTRMQDSVESVRKSAAVALGRIKDDRAIPSLIKGLSDPHYSVRMTSANSLVELGKPSVKPVLSLLSNSPGEPLYLAIGVLGRLKNKPAVVPLINKLKDQDWATRAFAVEALKEIGDPRGIRAIAELKKQETHPFVLSKIDKIK
jgi:HEAT repeat protein